MRDESVQRAIDAAGGVNALARAVSVSSATVAAWDVIPTRRMRRVAEVTGLPIDKLVPSGTDTPAQVAA